MPKIIGKFDGSESADIYTPPLDQKVIVSLDALSAQFAPFVPFRVLSNIQSVAKALKEDSIELTISPFGGIGSHFNINSNGIISTSADIPFLITIPDIIKEFLPNLKASGMFAIPSAVYSIMNAPNVQYLKRSLERMKNITTPVALKEKNSRGDEAVIMLRVSSGHFVKGRESSAAVIKEFLKDNPQVVITLEQDGKNHDSKTYLDIVQSLITQFPEQIGLSIDLGQYLRSHKYMDTTDSNSLKFFEDLMNSEFAKYVASVEIGDHHEEDITIEMASEIGRIYSENIHKSNFLPMIILEPGRNTNFSDSSTRLILNKIIDAFRHRPIES